MKKYETYNLRHSSYSSKKIHSDFCFSKNIIFLFLCQIELNWRNTIIQDWLLGDSDNRLINGYMQVTQLSHYILI